MNIISLNLFAFVYSGLCAIKSCTFALFATSVIKYIYLLSWQNIFILMADYKLSSSSSKNPKNNPKKTPKIPPSPSPKKSLAALNPPLPFPHILFLLIPLKSPKSKALKEK